MGDELTPGVHVERGDEPIGDAPAAAIDLAAQRRASRLANLKKAQAASIAARKAKAAKKGAKPTLPPSSPAGVEAGEDAMSAAIRQQFEVPLEKPEDLAQVLANLEQTCAALAGGTRGEPIFASLEWATAAGKPTPRCIMGARLMWPWLQKRNALAVLAEQSDTVLALCGLAVLVGPAIRPTLALVNDLRKPALAPPRAAPPAEPQRPAPAETPPPARLEFVEKPDTQAAA